MIVHPLAAPTPISILQNVAGQAPPPLCISVPLCAALCLYFIESLKHRAHRKHRASVTRGEIFKKEPPSKKNLVPVLVDNSQNGYLGVPTVPISVPILQNVAG